MPIAAVIAKSDIALLFLEGDLSCPVLSLDVTGPPESPVINTFSEKGDQECPGHDFCMSRSAVHYVQP